MDPSGSGALIALRSAAEGLRALGDTPQHRPQSPPDPPVGFGADRISLLSVPMSDRCAAQCPQPRASRAAVRAVPCRGVGGGGAWVCGGARPPRHSPPPPSPMSHTVRRGGCPLCEDGRWTGEGARQPYRPHCVCVGQSRMGGMEGGGGTWGSQPQRGRGARARGLPLMSAARINNRRAAGTNSSSVPDPPGAPALLGQSPPPFIPPLPFLPPALSVGWAADCRPGGVGSGCGMRDAGCGRRGAVHRAAEQSQRRADAPPSLQVPPPRLPPPPLGAAGSPPVAPMPSIPAALPSPLPTRPPLLARSLVPPPTALSCSRRSPRTPPTPPSGAAPAWLRPGCAHAVPRGGQC